MTKEIVSRHISKRFTASYLLATDKDRQIELNFFHSQPNSLSKIAILVVAYGGASINLAATVVIPANVANAVANLDIFCISDDSSTIIASPNLLVSNHTANANHSLTTYKLTKDEQFYLASRGLDSQIIESLRVNQLLQKFANATRL